MDIKQRWSQAVRWLHEQLEVRKTFELLFGKDFSFSDLIIIIYNQIILTIHHKDQ
jgi:hypothetical protein